MCVTYVGAEIEGLGTANQKGKKKPKTIVIHPTRQFIEPDSNPPPVRGRKNKSNLRRTKSEVSINKRILSMFEAGSEKQHDKDEGKARYAKVKKKDINVSDAFRSLSDKITNKLEESYRLSPSRATSIGREVGEEGKRDEAAKEGEEQSHIDAGEDNDKQQKEAKRTACGVSSSNDDGSGSDPTEAKLNESFLSDSEKERVKCKQEFPPHMGTG